MSGAQWNMEHYDWDPQALVAKPVGGTGASATSPFEQPTNGDEDLSGVSGSPKANGKAKKNGKAPQRRAAASVCQVVGCGALIQGGKSFFRLQRICEPHARAMAVTDVSGRMLRFCQQCTRMHPLSEFQDAKRSCIASLKRRALRKQALRDGWRLEAGAAAAAVQAPASRGGNQSKASKAPSASAAANPYADQQPPYAIVASDGALSADSGTHGSDFMNPLGGGSFHTDGSGSGSGNLGGISDNQLPHDTLLLQQQPYEPLHQQAHLLTAQQQLLQQHQQAHVLATSQPSAASSQLLGNDWLTQQDLLAPANRSGVLSPQHSLLQQGQLQRPAGAPRLGFPNQPPLLAPVGVPLATAASPTFVDLPRAGSSPFPAAHQASAQQGQHRLSELPTISAAELDMLLDLDPDNLADSLLARTAATSSTNSAGSLSNSLMPPPPNGAVVSSSGLLQQDLLGMVLPQAAPGTDAVVSGYAGVPAWSAPVPHPVAHHSPASTTPRLAAWAAAGAAVAALQSAAPPAAAASTSPGAVPIDFVVVRLSLKMYGLHPDQLPPSVRSDLQRFLLDSPTVLSGAVRSGCTHLTVSLLATSAEAAALQQPGGAAAVLTRLLHAWQRPSEGQQAWQLPAGLPVLKVVADVELGGAAVLLCPVLQCRLAAESAAVCAISGDSIAAAQQRLQMSLAPSTPAVMAVSECSGRFELLCPEVCRLLAGEPAGSTQRTLHCRSRGRYVPVALLPPHSSGHGGVERVGGGAAAAAGDNVDSSGESDSDMSGSYEDDWQEEEPAELNSGQAEEEEEAQQALELLLQRADAAEAWVPAAQAHPGLFEFELAAGPWLGMSVPALVLPAELAPVAAELQTLAETSHAAASNMLRLVRLALEFQESLQQAATAAAAGGPAAAAAAQNRHAAAYPSSGVARLAAAARMLCALCVRRQCPALLRLLLPTAIAGGDAAAAVAAIDTHLAPLGLLGLAAATGNAELLWALADLAPAAAAGHTWQRACSSTGLTPLHLAAALGHDLTQEAAAALVAALGGQACGTSSWCSDKVAGWTPCQVATAAGCSALLGLLGSSTAAAEEEGTPAAAATDTGPCTSSTTDTASLKPGKQQALLQPAATMGAASAGAAAQAQPSSKQPAEWAGGAEDEKPAGSYPQDSSGLEPSAGRLPVTAAELEVLRRRPMHPGVLVAMGGGAILLALGLVMALKTGLYD